MRTLPAYRHRSAFTMVELLVVIAVIGVLVAILLPSLRGASQGTRIAKTTSNLRQLGAATIQYLNVWNNHLPQRAWDVGGGQMSIIGTLFGGKRGELPFFGISECGSDCRPLNRYLVSSVGELSSGKDIEMKVFESPLDTGQLSDPRTDNFYDFLGSSYTLNDHSLDGEGFATLVPRESADGKPGGRMPRIADPTLTWMIGEHPIYNYQEGGDRKQQWYGGTRIRASLCFVDGHVAGALDVPPPGPGGELFNTTAEYTFLPDPDWFD